MSLSSLAAIYFMLSITMQLQLHTLFHKSFFFWKGKKLMS